MPGDAVIRDHAARPHPSASRTVTAPVPPPLTVAEGSCVKAYEWCRGGEWGGGRPWSAAEGLPTDSALLFYLFAAYLAAPQWLFPLVGGPRCGWGCG